MGEEVYFDCQAKKYTFPSDCSVCLSSYTPVRLSVCVFSTGFFLNKNNIIEVKLTVTLSYNLPIE